MQFASGVASSQPSPRYRNYVLTMLVIVYVFNFLDRQCPQGTAAGLIQ